MRLINTETLALEEFYSDIPPYAILSHRWESEEVTFQDYPTQTNPKNHSPMKGWKKIRYCIDQAKQDDLAYCWVDTCCIDKSSSAELTEAINSMYAWYRDSSVCYIYMSDVSISPALPRDVNDRELVREALEKQFKSSQWFKRGWTLQELLAPRKRVFYNTVWEVILDWQRQNPRFSYYRYLVVEATGIHIGALHNFNPRSAEYSVATKMSWASRRKTTRIEDIAYCLMGLFDINMSLLYGEGAKAFLRLQHEIIRMSNDHSIFCWRDQSATFSTHRGLLARSPSEFDGSSDVAVFPDDNEGGDLSLLDWDNKGDEPFLLTNRGLQITLPLASVSGLAPFLPEIGCVEKEEKRVGHAEFYARLNCKYRGLRSEACHCYLMLVHLGNGNFARVDLDRYARSSTEDDILLDAIALFTVKRIFVQDNVEVSSLYSSPRISRTRFSAGYALENLEVVHVEPPHQIWDGQDFLSIACFPTVPATKVTFNALFYGQPAHFTFSMEWTAESESSGTTTKHYDLPRCWKLCTRFTDSGRSTTHPKRGFAKEIYQDFRRQSDRPGDPTVVDFTDLIKREQVTTLFQDELIMKVKFFH